MKQCKKIDNVSKFLVENDELYFQKEKAIYHQENVIKVLQDSFFGEFYLNSGEIIVQNYYGEFECDNIKYKGYYNYLNNKVITYLDSTDNTIYLIQKGKNIKLNLVNQFNLFGNLVIFEKENQIHAYTFPTAEPLWQFDMGCLGMYETYKGEVKQYIVEKFIGVWEEELLVACSNGLILCIAISTGIEKRRWQQLEGYYPDVQGVSNKLPRTENFILDSQTNILIALHIFSVVIINLLTGDIEVIDMEQELRRLDVNLLKNNSSYGIDDGYIYTTATMAYSDDKSQWTYDCLLAINRNTYKVDWQYKFKEESLGTNTPQLSGDKLYQLTASNTLYIFEKENT
jgi:hypothetical protein